MPSRTLCGRLQGLHLRFWRGNWIFRRNRNSPLDIQYQGYFFLKFFFGEFFFFLNIIVFLLRTIAGGKFEVSKEFWDQKEEGVIRLLFTKIR